MKGQEVQTHETKQNGKAGNELRMSKVHNNRGVETKDHTASTRKTSCTQDVERSQTSILRQTWGLLSN